MRFTLDAVSTVTLIVNAGETRFVQDPLGLTRVQLATLARFFELRLAARHC